MKIEIEYKKGRSGFIGVSLRITDKQDFPEINVFSGTRDYPTNDDFSLESGFDNVIYIYVNTAEEARKWAAEQLSALGRHLKRWREIEIPEKENIEI